MFRNYLSYLLQEEGGRSSNPKDSAVRCAPYPGAVHTNKGVTFCTFKAYAANLGITPVTHARFLSLSNADAAKFLFMYYQDVGGVLLPDWLGLSLTEVAWGSGREVAAKTLQRALNALGNTLVVDGVIGPLTRQAVSNADKKALFDAFWEERDRWLRGLDDWQTFGKNWSARMARFIKKFAPAGGAALLMLTVAAAVLWIKSR